MSRFTERLAGITFTLTCYMLMVWIMSILPVDSDVEEISLLAAALAAFLCVVYLLDSVMLGHGGRLSLILAAHAALMAAGVCLYWFTTVFTPLMTGIKIFFAVCYAVCMVLAFCVAYSPVRPTTPAGCFDWAAIMMILNLVLRKISLTVLDREILLICAVVMALCLVTMLKVRLEAAAPGGKTVGNAGAGKLLMGVLFAVIVVLAAIICVAAAGMLHGLSEGILAALKSAWAGIVFVIGHMYRLLESFLRWITQWADTGEEEAALGGVSDISMDYEAEEVQAQIPFWFYIVLAAAAAALIVFLFIKIRKVRLEKHSRTALVQPEVVRSGGLIKAIRERLAKLKARAAFLLRYRKSLNTPAGMLIWCERRFRKSCPRRISESGTAYLCRLSEDEAGLKAGAELKELARMTELEFYAPEESLGRTGADKEFYLRIRKALC